MTSANDPADRLSRLLDPVLDGSADDATRSELARLLDDEPGLTPLLVEQLRTEAALRLRSQTLGVVTAASGPAPLACIEPPGLCGTGPLSTGRPWLCTALGALALVLGFWIVSGRPDEVSRAVAQVVAVSGDAGPAWRVGATLAPGPLTLQQAGLTLRFTSGAEMQVAAPASLDLRSPDLVHLERGQATFMAPAWARDFTVTTAEARIDNPGTRFGVAALEDALTDVVVFEGDVSVHTQSGAGLVERRRLRQGEAARVGAEGDIRRIFDVHGDWHDNAWSTAGEGVDRGAIAAVWDGFGPRKSVSFYQVIRGGFGEDAPAYVDHPHQWNGATRRGLPSGLQGADYVRTANDVRYHAQLAISVEFASDSTLYVLFDNRVAPPEWLTGQFELTGETVGLDEDAWDGNPTFSVERGPGRSIDNTFSLWRRACQRGEVFVLGSMGAGREARAMYGVAAVAQQPAKKP